MAPVRPVALNLSLSLLARPPRNHPILPVQFPVELDSSGGKPQGRTQLTVEESFSTFPREFQNSETFALDAVRHMPSMLPHARAFRNNPDFVMKAVVQNPEVLRFAPDYQNNGSFVLEAMAQNIDVLQYASSDLLANSEFLKEAVTKNPEALRFAPGFLRPESGPDS